MDTRFTHLGRPLPGGNGCGCVPSAIAMLVWNMGYGLGAESAALRSAIAVQRAGIRQRPPHRMPEGDRDTPDRLFDGIDYPEIPVLLRRYGLIHETVFHQDFASLYLQQTGHLIAANRVPPIRLAQTLNELADGDGAIVAGRHPNGIAHGIAVLRRGNVLAALDASESGLCWAPARGAPANGIARIDYSTRSLTICGGIPHPEASRHNWHAPWVPQRTVLAQTYAAYVIRRQPLLAVWRRIITQWPGQTWAPNHHSE